MGDNDFERYHWDSERCEYFIDRHRGTFEVISNWMMRQGPLGRLCRIFYLIDTLTEFIFIDTQKVRPDHIPIDIFLNEISFYRLR